MEHNNTVPISIKARKKDLLPRPEWFITENPITNDPRAKNSIKGYQQFLNRKNKRGPETINNLKSFKEALNCFKVLNQNGAIVHVKCNSAITLCGYLKVTAIYGHLAIFGYNMRSKSVKKSVTLYGSKELQAYSIHGKNHKEKDYSYLKHLFGNEIPLSELDILALLSNINADDSVLLLEELPLPSIFKAKSYLKSLISPVSDNTPTAVPKCKKWLNCAINCADDGNIPQFIESPEWLSMNLSSRTVVIGGEGTGKSTLIKYMMNKLLGTYNAVLYLELDIGQGEFSPPGCVALIIVEQPIFGPNFTHLIVPERMIHLGEVDAAKCSSQYLESVAVLAKEVNFNSIYAGMPLVVNTMGFCKGLGLHLAIRTINILKPTTVIQLNSDTAKKNFEKQLTPEVVSENVLDYQFCLIQSVSSGCKRVGSKREARERMLLSYFSPVLIPPYYSFNSVRPYCVSFADVSIGVTSNIAVGNVLGALNGCLVALCEKPGSDAKILRSNVEGWFNIILKPSVQSCLGLGLIRGIDVEKRLLFVVTPLDMSKLDRVEVLQMSHVEVPATVFTNQEGAEGTVPYVTSAKQDLPFVSLKRVFHHRKFHQAPFNDAEMME